MPYELTKKLRSVDTYQPAEEEAEIRLDANESCFDIAQEMGEAIAKAVAGISMNRYPDPSAKAVTEAFAEYYGIDPAYCTAGNGSDELIGLILSSYLEKGDNVLILSPDFSMYAFYGYMSELKIKTLHKEEDLKINVSKVIEYCNNNDVKAVIFSNPCNPTSMGVTRQDMIRLVRNVFCLVIVDEAYMDFWGESIMDKVSDFDNLIVLKTCSKNMGMAALRLGFAIACPNITEAMKAVKSPYNINAVTQAAACEVLKNKALLTVHTAEIIRNRKKLQSAVSELAERFFVIEKVYDSVTNFVFIKTAAAEEIYNGLLERSVRVRRLGSYIRITVGTESENARFLEAFEDTLGLIQGF